MPNRAKLRRAPPKLLGEEGAVPSDMIFATTTCCMFPSERTVAAPSTVKRGKIRDEAYNTERRRITAGDSSFSYLRRRRQRGGEAKVQVLEWFVLSVTVATHLQDAGIAEL